MECLPGIALYFVLNITKEKVRSYFDEEAEISRGPILNKEFPGKKILNTD
jgi:hypothetical protein